MSDTSQGPGWWLASDGRWYPPEQAPAAMPAPPQQQFAAPQAAAPTLTAPRTAAYAPTAPAYPHPQAGQYQMPPGYGRAPKKRRRWPWVVLGVVVLLVAAVAIAGTAEEEAPTSAPTGAEAGGATGEPAAPDAGAAPLTVGSTDNTSGFDVTLLQFVDQWQPTNEFEAPSPGMRYIAVELDMVNTDDEVQTFSTILGLEVVDSLGQRWNPAFAGFDLPQLGGDVVPGTNIRGWQVFEVPVDATGLQLRVKGSITASGVNVQLS